MTREMTNIFHITELYLLAAAFDAETLFGLPDKKTYQLLGAEPFDEAYTQLMNKEILTSKGKITKAGAYVIRALEFYYQSEKYVRIHNLMFGFRSKDEDELIMLVEVKEWEQYRLYVISKAFVLKLLSDRFPLILREPKEEEKTFLKRELSPQLKNEIKGYEPGDNFLNIEFFHFENRQQKRPTFNFRDVPNPSTSKEKTQLSSGSNISTTRNRIDETPSEPKLSYQQWLIFTKDDQLFMVDPMRNKYYHVSQYWFLKILFDAMDFPYKERVSHG